jgi:hypothetical protein
MRGGRPVKQIAWLTETDTCVRTVFRRSRSSLVFILQSRRRSKTKDERTRHRGSTSGPCVSGGTLPPRIFRNCCAGGTRGQDTALSDNGSSITAFFVPIVRVSDWTAQQKLSHRYEAYNQGRPHASVGPGLPDPARAVIARSTVYQPPDGYRIAAKSFSVISITSNGLSRGGEILGGQARRYGR